MTEFREFSDEKIESQSYDYPKGYNPKEIDEQIDFLRKIFPVTVAREKVSQQSLPVGAEGWFAIPRWQAVANSYSEALQKLFDILKRQRRGRLHNYREGRREEQYIQHNVRTAKKLKAITKQQDGAEIIIIAAQSGHKYRGCSNRCAREMFEEANEFGLGAFEVGCMLLTHPERLQDPYNLWVDCAGDEYPVNDGGFPFIPHFGFFEERVKFDVSWIGRASARCGSATGFVI